MLSIGGWRMGGGGTATSTSAPRPESKLPMIKCSNCAADIEISSLAEHICSSSAPAPAPKKTFLERANTLGSSKSNGFLKPGRPGPPPMIDAAAANKPFARPNQIERNALTPGSSYSDPRSLSPLPLNVSNPKSPKPGKLLRSQTSPMPRGPPSPDLPTSWDNPYPTFPTPRAPAPVNSKQKTPPRRPERPERSELKAPVMDALMAPLSPRMNSGASVVKRMDTIKPGPFDGRKTPVEDSQRRPSTSASGSHNRNVSSSSRGHNRGASLASSHGSRASTHSVGLPSGPASGAVPPMPRPPRTLPGQNQDARSNMYPMRQASKDSNGPNRPFERRPSVPRDGMIYGSLLSQSPPTEDMEDYRSLNFQSRAAANNPFPTRGASKDAPKPSLTLEKPTNLLGGDLLRSPESVLHTPSDSASSDGSHSSFDARSASSMSSAPNSEHGGRSRRPSKPGSIDQNISIDDFLERQKAMPSRRERNHAQNPSQDRTQAPAPAPMPAENGGFASFASRARDLLWNAPAKAEDKPQQPEPEPVPVREIKAEPAPRVSKESSRPLPPAESLYDNPDSPMDPAIQRGLFSQRNPSKSSNSSPPRRPTREPVNEQEKPPRFDPAVSRARDPANIPVPPIPASTDRLPVRRPTTKGNCRGCGQTIVGKSVKAADGGLTGRWHKACFVCKICREPFQTADFYVHNNHPYCERHYHEINGSLCKKCDRGIEGQYLATEQNQKFHPACFTCSHCRIPLRDDYFELGGKIYCERHAYSMNQQNNGGFLGAGMRNPERRRTRLMMM